MIPDDAGKIPVVSKTGRIIVENEATANERSRVSELMEVGIVPGSISNSHILYKKLTRESRACCAYSSAVIQEQLYIKDLLVLRKKSNEL